MKRTKYEAEDGELFATSAECKQHERHKKLKLLVLLTEDAVDAAIDRTDLRLADAIEFAGNLIAQNRRESGALKRKTMRKLPISL